MLHGEALPKIQYNSDIIIMLFLFTFGSSYRESEDSKILLGHPLVTLQNDTLKHLTAYVTVTC